MGKANTCMWTGHTTRVNGSTTSTMDTVKKYGQMVLFLKANTRWAKSMAVESLSGPTAAHSKATLLVTKWRAWAFISGLTVGRTQASGKIIYSMVRATLPGMMEESISANT